MKLICICCCLLVCAVCGAQEQAVISADVQYAAGEGPAESTGEDALQAAEQPDSAESAAAVVTADDWLLFDALWNGVSGARGQSELLETFLKDKESAAESPRQAYYEYLAAVLSGGYGFERGVHELLLAECLWYVCFARPAYNLSIPALDAAADAFLSQEGLALLPAGACAYRFMSFMLDTFPDTAAADGLPSSAAAQFAVPDSSVPAAASIDWLAPRFVQAASRAKLLAQQITAAADETAAVQGVISDISRDAELLYVLYTDEAYGHVWQLITGVMQAQHMPPPERAVLYGQCLSVIIESNLLCAEYGIPLERVLPDRACAAWQQIMQSTFALAALDTNEIENLLAQLSFINLAVPVYAKRAIGLLQRN